MIGVVYINWLIFGGYLAASPPTVVPNTYPQSIGIIIIPFGHIILKGFKINFTSPSPQQKKQRKHEQQPPFLNGTLF